MITYTLTRLYGGLTLVLRYTPALEGKYLAEASTNGGATYTSSQLCEKEQVEWVVRYARTTINTIVEEINYE